MIFLFFTLVISVWICSELDVLNIIKMLYINYPSNLPFLYQIMYTLFAFVSTLKINILQKLNGNIVKVSRDRYLVNYCINGKVYRMITRVKKGPLNIIQVIDNNSSDITSIVTPYIGPNHTFTHNEILTPSFFGCNEMTIHLGNGDTKVIKENEFID